MLPFNSRTTTVDLKKHFLTKVSKVKDVRIPLDPKTRKQRGFGYIEVENKEDYEVKYPVIYKELLLMLTKFIFFI